MKIPHKIWRDKIPKCPTQKSSAALVRVSIVAYFTHGFKSVDILLSIIFKDRINLTAEKKSYFKVIGFKGFDIPGRVSAIFTTGNNFCDLLFLPVHQSPFWKGV